MNCKKCGAFLNPDTVFCPTCGTKVSNDSNQLINNNNNNYQGQVNNSYPVQVNNSYPEQVNNSYPEQINVKKSNIKNIVKVVIAIEIVLVLLSLINDFRSFVLGMRATDSSAFMSTMQKYGYNVVNNTADYTAYDYMHEVYTATNNGIKVRFVSLYDKSYAASLFEELKNNVNKNAGIITYGTEDVAIFNHKKYSIVSSTKIIAVIQKGNIVLLAEGTRNDQNELNIIFSDLGCGNLTVPTFTVIVLSLICILGIVAEWKIFEKAGLKGWYVLIPFYNLYCLFKVAFGKGSYVFMLLIPFANFVMIFLLGYKLAKAFGKSTLFAVLSIFFACISMQIIAFDDSEYLLKANNM